MTGVPRVRAAVGAAALASYRTARRVRGHAFSRAVSGGFAEFGPHSVLDPPVDIRGARMIAIGAHVWVGPGSWLYAIPETAAEEPVLVVGDGVNISGNCVLSAVVLDPPRPRRAARPQRLHLRPLARVRGRHAAGPRAGRREGPSGRDRRRRVARPGRRRLPGRQHRPRCGRGRGLGRAATTCLPTPSPSVRPLASYGRSAPRNGCRCPREARAGPGAGARLLLPARRWSRRAADDRLLPPPSRPTATSRWW